MAPPTKAKRSSPPAAKCLPRRPPVVDTNTLSYDRTDPFHAINALRKLIGCLASRVGGCQYRFTPDEHKLSIHLLTIIEPFVSLSPSSRTLTHQPTEILDAIVSHVDSKRDLFSLALSCRRLHTVVIPRHYDYRVLLAKASSISLWNHLIVNRALARNVRAIEIVDERSLKPLVLPADIVKADTDPEAPEDGLALHSKQEALLISALTQMTSLRSFLWSCNHSTISMDNLWATLSRCETLAQVIIHDNFVFLPYAPDTATPVDPKSVSVLPELKSIALQATKHAFGSTKTPALARISGMLTSCPNLESLDIGYEHRRVQGQRLPTADAFFLCSRWPALRSLSLANLRCSSAHSLESASVFFAAHSNIEVLHLDLPPDRSTPPTGAIPRLVLPPNALPKLRELRCGKTVATAILSCPTDSPRPLETLKGITLSGSNWDGPFLASLKQCGGSVRRMELAGWNDLDDIKRLIECVPRLTWLDVSKHTRTAKSHELRLSPLSLSQGARRNDTLTGRVAASHNGGHGVATNVTEWATVLAPLVELTTLVGVKFFYEVSTSTLAALASGPPVSLSPSELSRVRKNDKVAGVLGNKCPTLRRLDHWEDAGGRAIMLSRDGNEVRWEVKRLKV